jgi:hypothetical protein
MLVGFTLIIVLHKARTSKQKNQSALKKAYQLKNKINDYENFTFLALFCYYDMLATQSTSDDGSVANGLLF